MKRWEIEELSEIFTGFHFDEQTSSEYVAKRDNLLRNLRDISELIPEVKYILDQFDLKTNSGAENAAIVCKCLLDANNQKRGVWLIDLYKTELNSSVKQEIKEQIKQYICSLDEDKQIELGIDPENIDFDTLRESLIIDIQNKIAEAKNKGINLKKFIKLEEKEDIYCKRGYILLKIHRYYLKLKQKQGYSVAKKFALEWLSKYRDESVRNFLPELKARDSEFFDVYITYLKYVGRYYLVINTEDVNDLEKKQVTAQLDKVEQEKNELLYQKREKEKIRSTEYDLAIGRINIIREQDGITLFIQPNLESETYTYKINTRKHEKLTSKQKAYIIEKILGLPANAIYLYGIQVLTSRNYEHKIPQTSENISAMDEILSNVDPAILAAYYELQFVLCNKFKHKSNLLAVLQKEDIENELINFVELSTKYARQFVQTMVVSEEYETSNRDNHSIDEYIKNKVNQIIQNMQNELDEKLTDEEKLKALRQMVYDHITAYNPDLDADFSQMSEEQLYNQLLQSERQKRFTEYKKSFKQESNHLKGIDSAFNYTETRLETNLKKAEKRAETVVEDLIEYIKTKNPNLQSSQILKRTKEVIANYIRKNIPNFEIDEGAIDTKRDLVELILKYVTNYQCGHITYHITEQNEKSSISKFAEIARKANIADIVRGGIQILFKRVSGFMGRIRASIQRFSSPVEDEYDYKIESEEEK